jgi:transposase
LELMVIPTTTYSGATGGFHMPPRYRIILTEQERKDLKALTRSGKTGVKEFIHARALLLCDEGPEGPAWTVAAAAKALGVTSRTIEYRKKRYVEDGLKAALARKAREKPSRDVIFDGTFEARLIALACSGAPKGHHRWTVRLLADKAVEHNFAPSVSHMTVQRVLKKRNVSLTSGHIGRPGRKGAMLS